MLADAFSKKTKKCQLTIPNGIPNGTTVSNYANRKFKCDLFLQIKWLIWRSAIATGRSFRNKLIHIALHMVIFLIKDWFSGCAVVCKILNKDHGLTRDPPQKTAIADVN